jgi:hypothetical protein
MNTHNDLIARLPYTGNMRLLTEISELSLADRRARAWRVYPAEDPLVKGHCRGRYIAGCLLTEQVCQTALLLFYALPLAGYDDAGMPLLVKICSDYLLPIPAGERVETEARIIHCTPAGLLFTGEAGIDGKIAVSVKATAKLVS